MSSHRIDPSPSPHRIPPAAVSHRLALALVVLSGLGAECTRDQQAAVPVADGSGRAAPVVPARKPAPPHDPRWKEVDKLVEEQKLEEASTRVAAILADAKAKSDEDEWARALVRLTTLRMGLHGNETAVRQLRTEPWPKDATAHAIVSIYYASALLQYVDMYRWEIEQRERVETKGPIDLKSWTRDQIVAEALKAIDEPWQMRESLAALKVSDVSEFIEPNSYPPGVRDTVRDAVSYMVADLLNDTGNWKPEEQSGVYRLDFKALLAGKPGPATGLRIDDAARHPIERIAAVLDDLEGWHAKESHKEAALEARLARLRYLGAHFTDAKEKTALREALERRLADARGVAWWAWGMGDLAERWRQSGDLVRARRVAEEGRAAYPDTVGGKRCLAIVKAIEAPDVQLQSMTADAAGKRSIELRHKNLERVWLRAWRFDVMAHIAAAKDYNLLPAYGELQKWIARRPDIEWSVELPPTPDYKQHRTFVTPPIDKPGFYVIVASAKADFPLEQNRLLGVVMGVSDLVLATRNEEGEVFVTVSSGSTGKPAAGVEVHLYRYDWNRGHSRVDTRRTDPSGEARLRRGGDAPHFVLAQRGEEVALDPQAIYLQRSGRPSETNAALVYTDRSIYRPQQTIYWKVVAYRGDAEKASWRVSPRAPVEVKLLDANGEEVLKKSVTTNDFGTAAGEFAIPGGRLLGEWQVMAGASLGSASVRVEEYKRPTFEVTLKDPEAALRLNQSAKMIGEARYYFGLPVTSGKIRWRVARVPVYPWWWGLWFPTPSPSENIAGGTASLEPDGRFRFAFTPEADERKAAIKGMSYRYEVVADLTDDGGETRSATRSFRVGFVAVEASITAERSFAVEGEPAELRLVRTNLDGAPRAGKGSWRLVALDQPKQAVVPSELPLRQAPVAESGEGEGGDDGEAGGNAASPPGDAKPYRTPGDSLRPRWETSVSMESIMADWKDGAEKARGELTHDDKGVARLTLPALTPGAWRLHYQTVDEFGAKYDTWRDVIVAAKPGAPTPLSVPLALMAQSTSVKVGGAARLLVQSGLPDQVVYLDVFRAGRLVERRRLGASGSAGGTLVEIPIRDVDRGGFSVRAWAVRDHQYMERSQTVFVPWDDKELVVELSTFRDKLRPGGKETWRVTVKDPMRPKGGRAEAGAAELLAYMYDRSLDVFAPHAPPSIASLYPSRASLGWMHASLGTQSAAWLSRSNLVELPAAPSLQGDRLKVMDAYGIGGLGLRGYGRGGGGMGRIQTFAAAPPAESAARAEGKDDMPKRAKKVAAGDKMAEVDADEERVDARIAKPAAQLAANEPIRSNFAETAFWRPQLVTDADGGATIEFTVPDSVTAWNVWVHAMTRDLRGGSITKEARTVKELMVRPYLPRFFREGDQAELKVVVNNASDKELKGQLTLAIEDPDKKPGEKDARLDAMFGLKEATRSFTVAPGRGADLAFAVTAPRRVGPVAFRVTARAADLSDGELRPLPVLPGRMHLAQSRFAVLRDSTRRALTFNDMARTDDPSRLDESLVVTLDAQLFYGVLKALPYLVEYPYECTEQTMNRFVSTGILTSLYGQYPAVSDMARQLSARKTRLETFDAPDPNRKMALEESPWLMESRGGASPGGADLPLINVLDPRIARAQRDESLAKLQKAQTASGGFPWFPGGPPSPYMTLYLMYGFGKAAEFKVDVPRDMVVRGWQYLARHFRDDYAGRMMKDEVGWEFLTFLAYTATSYPDASWTGGALTEDEIKRILDYSFKHWKQHSPQLKAMLAMTLQRRNRADDARLVWASVMDSAKTTPEEGTFWAPEDRSWLWYNDTIETHAWALRTQMVLEPKEQTKADGMVLWLFLNKKLNHWKSTRATAEVIYSLVKYLERTGGLGVREEATVTVGDQKSTFTFAPDKYTGRAQVVVPGEKIVPAKMSTVTVEKQTKGYMFASATWHFSTDKLPAEDRGDFFNVSRRFFKRENTGKGFVLTPLAEGAPIAVGDEIEIELSLRTKHAAEYVHLRDPRAAGCEPASPVSKWKWDLGIAWYEEIRDSGTNFFFEQLPVGEYTFKYRVRAATAGTFKVGPATVQSMYAPEFAAYSAGTMLSIK